MSRTARRLGIAIGSLVALVLVALLAVPYVVSLDAVRARVVAAAESSLHRKVEIGAMRLQVLSGLGAGIERLVVHDRRDPGAAPLLSADRAAIKVAFWPLLSRRIEVRRLELRGVTVTVERGADARLSVDDFVSAGGRDSAPASQTAAAVLLIARIDLEGGRAVFVDHRSGRTETLTLDDVTAHLRDIGARTPARFDVAARFLAEKGRNVTLEGTLGPPPSAGPVGEAPLDARFSARDLALARLSPWIAAFRENDPGTLAIEGNAKGKILGALAIAAKIGLDPPPVSKTRMPPVDGTVAVTVDWPKGTLSIGRSLFDLAELPLAIEGRVDRLHETPELDLNVSTPGEVPLDHVTGLPGLAGRFPEGMRIAGRAHLDVRLTGPAAAPAVRGTFDAAPLTVVRQGETLFEAPSTHATVDAERSDVLSGRVTASSGKMRRLPFEALVADWTWRRGAFVLSPKARVYGGALAARIEGNAAQPGSEARLAFSVENLPARPLVDATTKTSNVLSGTLSGNVALTSLGIGFDALVKSGRGGGHVVLADADLRTVELMPEVTNALQKIGGMLGLHVPDALRQTRFSKLEATLRLADGRVATPDLVLSGSGITVAAEGSFGLDKTLAYRGRVDLGPSLIRELGGLGQYVADDTGHLVLPFEARGTVEKPDVSIEGAALFALGQRVLKRGAVEALRRHAGAALGGPEAPLHPMDLLQRFLGAPSPSPTPPPR